MIIRRPTAEQLAPIEALRVQIADLQNQVRAIEQLPPDASTIDARIEALASSAIDKPSLTMLRRELLATKFNPVTAAVALRDLTPATIAVACMRESLIEGLRAMVGADTTGISDTDRAKRLKALQAELDKFERQEEELLAELEADAYVVRRRPNARAEIVLGTI